MPESLNPSPQYPGEATKQYDPNAHTATHTTDARPTATMQETVEPLFAMPEYAGELGRFGRYRVLKKLGQGGMGAVYLGYDAALDRKLALKVMLPTFAAKSDARERFLREARTAAMVRSDHVVTVFDVGEEQFVPFIAMEYLLGSPLDKYLKENNQLPLPQVLRVCRETAIGLAAAHSLGLVHRDIKPGNLWLEAPKGRVKLLDFGLARIEDDDTQLTGSGAVVGTPAYMSPEQGRGLKVDHRTDLFSLGVVLYQLTTGRMPFSGSSTMAILTSLAIDTPIPPRQIRPDLPETVETVITRMIAKNPDERFQSAMEVADALCDIERGKPVQGVMPIVLPVESLVVGVQTQNVWDGIEDHEAVPEATLVDATTDPVTKPDPVQKPERKKPERKVSKVPVILAGVAMIAAVGLLLSLLSPPSNGPLVANNDEPDTDTIKKSGNRPPSNKTQPTPQLQPQPIPPNPTADRKAAELVTSLGGFVRINGNYRAIRDSAVLPNAAFALTSVYLNAGTTPRPLADPLLEAFKECKELSGLVLISCIVTDNGLANFKGCTKLRELALYGQKVGDVGVANFQGCDALESLYLHGTSVTDKGLATFKDCKNLSSLRLSNMKVSNAGLTLFKDCTKLETLSLDQTVALSADLAVFANCQAIKDLDLSGNPIGDDALPHFKGSSELMAVNLSGTRVSDTGLEFFKNNQTLRELNLGGTAVTGAGLAHLGGCQRLGILQLQGVKIGGDTLTHLKACSNLYSLNLQGTPITDQGLNGLADFPRLQVLQLRGTKVGTDAARKLADKLPDCRIEWDGGVIEPKDDPDRKAAEWLIANNAAVSVFVNGKEVPGLTATTLPRERFEIRYINVNRNPLVNDETMACLNGVRHITSAQITNVAVTDKTLAYIKDCKNLEHLILYASRITDDGLKVLAGFKELRSLNITQLPLTEPAVLELAAALPKCKIAWAKGMVEPKK
ncbi:MAG: protein kinase [Planctomycetes bacterium]|nr:protein kinase [Planctomycetota bacterium]